MLLCAFIVMGMAVNAAADDTELKKASEEYNSCLYYYFKGTDIPFSVKDADLSAYRMKQSGSMPQGVVYLGSSLDINGSIALRHYYSIAPDAGSVKFTVDGKSAGLKAKNGRKYIEIPGIAVEDIDKTNTVTVYANGAVSEMEYSVLSYAYAAKEQNSDANLIKLLKSLYWYKLALDGASGEETETLSGYMDSKYPDPMPEAVIVIPKNANAEEKYAADLIQKYLKIKDSSAKPAIIKDSEAQGSHGFEISVGKTTRPKGSPKYTSDGSYSIKSYNGGIAITGVGQLGLMHGAMRFMEACGGYFYLSWDDLYITHQPYFKYDPAGISIDYERAFVFTDMDICFSSINPNSDLTDPYYGKDKPSGYKAPKTGRLFSLAFGLNGFYADQYTLPTSEAGREKWYLTAFGKGSYDDTTPIDGLAAGQAHTLLAEFLPAAKYYDAHPEWYAANSFDELKLPDAQRSRTKAQLCLYTVLNDPEAYSIILNHCKDMIKKTYDPNAPIQIISISKNDGPDLCLCSKCLKDRSAHGDKEGLHESIEMVQLVNKVSQDLHKDGAYPNLYIDFLAYEWTKEAPDDPNLKCDDHVIARWAPIRRCYGNYLNDSSDVTNQSYYRDLTNWTKCCKHVWIWDYNAPFLTTAGPYPNVSVMQHDIKFYKSIGVEGIYLQSNSRHLESNSEFGDIRNFILARMLQDPSRNYEKELEFITDELYGKCGVYVREYMKHMEKQMASHHELSEHKDKTNLYNTPLYGIFAGVRDWDNGVHSYRMPDSEIGICEGLWREIDSLAANESPAVQKRLKRLEFSWRLVKSTLNVYEFSDPSTYSSKNKALIDDMIKAGVTYYSMIRGKLVEDCVKTQYHPDNWTSKDDDEIGRFTAANPGGNLKPSIPSKLFTYYSRPSP